MQITRRASRYFSKLPTLAALSLGGKSQKFGVEEKHAGYSQTKD
jgi:hypothetical protein